MKQTLTKLAVAMAMIIASPAIFAENLLDVFNQAMKSDPVFQQANETRLVANIGIPIAFSVLMPQFNTYAAIQVNNVDNRGGGVATPTGSGSGSIGGTTSSSAVVGGSGVENYNAKGYQLNLTQYLFNYSDWATWKAARASSKAANATFTAALQSLMSRTAQAYLAVLQAQDDLRYVQAEKKATYQQLDQVSQEYKVGLVAITSVYQAQAAYDSITSQEIADQNAVINQRENLRVITGIYYNDLYSLKTHIPLIMPVPADPAAWVSTAGERNWSILASRYNAQAAQENVFSQEGGHLPTVQAYATRQYIKGSANVADRLDVTNNFAGVQLSLPVFQGGLVNAETKQASYQYQASLDQIEQTYRDVYNQTEQGYNNVVTGVSRVRADSQAIVSNASSLRSTIEAFRVGTETMLDVLTAQQNLFNAERQFSFDEYSYLNATISLKQAAGTLNYNDLILINKMLVPSDENYSSLNIQSIQAQAQRDYSQNVKESNNLMSSGGMVVPVSPYGTTPSSSSLPTTGMPSIPGSPLPTPSKPLPLAPTMMPVSPLPGASATMSVTTATTVTKPVAQPTVTTTTVTKPAAAPTAIPLTKSVSEPTEPSASVNNTAAEGAKAAKPASSSTTSTVKTTTQTSQTAGQHAATVKTTTETSQSSGQKKPAAQTTTQTHQRGGQGTPTVTTTTQVESK